MRTCFVDISFDTLLDTFRREKIKGVHVHYARCISLGEYVHRKTERVQVYYDDALLSKTSMEIVALR
jgi:hypothetical protein